MMTPHAVGHPEHSLTETIKTEGRLERLKTKNEGCLPEQGPAVVPLHGKGGSPIRLKKHSVEEKSLNLYDYRQNLHKETLKLELAEP